MYLAVKRTEASAELAACGSDNNSGSNNPATTDAPSNAPPQVCDNEADILEGMLWNLRTWPLEAMNWEVTNSHR
jgi:hypothetical protein